jgi:AcrR family transcriptional regulator
MADKRRQSRSERRAAARRQQILNGAAQVFADKGFARATTKEIAEAADVSEGTIYNYFDSKRDLLMGLMTRVAETQLAGAGPRAAEEGREQLEGLGEDALLSDAEKYDLQEFLSNVFRWRQRFVVEHKPMLQALLAEMLVNPEFRTQYRHQLIEPFMSLFEEQVKSRITEGDVRSIDAPLTVRFLSAVNLGMLGLLIMGDSLLEEKWESQELVEELTDLVLRGIGTQDESR